ncbi:MAG: ABC-type polysaccharide/polyol phosphate export permease [Kiritimatiellia bacterium]|jgi:ABC-type polysaccharide/polyol phosphate export permease
MKFSPRRELIATLVKRELRTRYKGSSLGVLWSIITPLFMAIIYAFFFRLIAGVRAPTHSIIIGVFAWQFTASSVNAGMMCITGNSNLIKKVSFARWVLPASVTLAGMIDYLISLLIQVALVVFLLMKSEPAQMISWMVIFVPVVLIYHAVFNYGVALLLSSLNVYFRDTQHFVNVALSACFFLSPAMYDMAFVRASVGRHTWILDVYMLNPLTIAITWYRKLMIPDVAFEWTPWALAGLIWPFFFAAGAYVLFQRMQKNFADYV